jgi:hypothetical protein
LDAVRAAWFGRARPQRTTRLPTGRAAFGNFYCLSDARGGATQHGATGTIPAEESLHAAALATSRICVNVDLASRS